MPAKRTDREYIFSKIPELYQNHTASEIAAILSKDQNVHAPVSESAIRNFLNFLRSTQNLELKEKPWTHEEYNFLVALYEEGASIPAIAERLGRSIPAIHARISRSGLANRKTNDAEREKVKDLLQTSNLSLAEIAFNCDLPYNAVQHIWDQIKPQGTHRKNRVHYSLFWTEGSLAERLLRSRLKKRYGDAVVPWQHNRDWSEGRGQIDIPIVLADRLKFAIEINHFRTHANRRNKDYAKRIKAEMNGWVWIPLWINQSPTHSIIEEAMDTITKIISERCNGSDSFYVSFIKKVAELETQYYAPLQDPYDPKEHVKFGPFWDENDVAVVIENYGRISIEEIQNRLLTPRTRDAIMHKARALGLTKQKTNFTQAEDEIIRRIYPIGSREAVLAQLPGRTWQSVSTRVFSSRPN